MVEKKKTKKQTLKDILEQKAEKEKKETEEQKQKTDRRWGWSNASRKRQTTKRGLQKLYDTLIIKSRHKWLFDPLKLHVEVLIGYQLKEIQST